MHVSVVSWSRPVLWRFPHPIWDGRRRRSRQDVASDVCPSHYSAENLAGMKARNDGEQIAEQTTGTPKLCLKRTQEIKSGGSGGGGW